ncbi:caspase family protein [Saprospira grandis]|uniref:Uncharacterized protein n=1 Tax=Saprospira grandis (strain Lewin) TaxID=984262 RepID=H6LAN5_SAPGL|nr:caspase family protein [Saprospira grandis]AFC25628.1 hypothetical protein SGRA_2900 [Saprospira grandis str. Lewin]
MNKSKTYIISVALDYESKEEKKLENAVIDSQLIVDAITKKFDLGGVEPYFLVNKNATEEKLRETIKKIEVLASVGDSLLFIYNGHAEKTNEEKVTWNLYDKKISASDFIEDIAYSNLKDEVNSMVFILNHCYATSLQNRPELELQKRGDEDSLMELAYLITTGTVGSKVEDEGYREALVEAIESVKYYEEKTNWGKLLEEANKKLEKSEQEFKSKKILIRTDKEFRAIPLYVKQSEEKEREELEKDGGPISAYEQFINKYPNSPAVEKFKLKVDSAKEIQRIDLNRIRDAIKFFIERFPIQEKTLEDAQDVEDVRELRELLLEVKNSNSKYIDEVFKVQNTGEQLKKIQKIIDDREVDKAKAELNKLKANKVETRILSIFESKIQKLQSFIDAEEEWEGIKVNVKRGLLANLSTKVANFIGRYQDVDLCKDLVVTANRNLKSIELYKNYKAKESWEEQLEILEKAVSTDVPELSKTRLEKEISDVLNEVPLFTHSDTALVAEEDEEFFAKLDDVATKMLRLKLLARPLASIREKVCNWDQYKNVVNRLEQAEEQIKKVLAAFKRNVSAKKKIIANQILLQALNKDSHFFELAELCGMHEWISILPIYREVSAKLNQEDLPEGLFDALKNDVKSEKLMSEYESICIDYIRSIELTWHLTQENKELKDFEELEREFSDIIASSKLNDYIQEKKNACRLKDAKRELKNENLSPEARLEIYDRILSLELSEEQKARYQQQRDELISQIDQQEEQKKSEEVGPLLENLKDKLLVLSVDEIKGAILELKKYLDLDSVRGEVERIIERSEYFLMLVEKWQTAQHKEETIDEFLTELLSSPYQYTDISNHFDLEVKKARAACREKQEQSSITRLLEQQLVLLEQQRAKQEEQEKRQEEQQASLFEKQNAKQEEREKQQREQQKEIIAVLKDHSEKPVKLPRYFLVVILALVGVLIVIAVKLLWS